MQAENGSKPEMLVVVPEERLREMPPSAAQQAENEVTDGAVGQAQYTESSPAAQQAHRVSASSTELAQQPMRDISAGENGVEDSGTDLKSLEEVAHPQDVDGQTFFDAQEGVRL